MAKEGYPPDQQLELTFPVSGIDITTEFELQPANTCPIAINVRSVEPGTQRNRGGSRSGLSRYVNDRPGGLSSLIQHLNVIVDPTVAATGGQDESNEVGPVDHGGDGSGYLDPSNNPDPANPRNPGDRYIRRGGSGHMQKKGAGTKVLATAVADSLSASIGDPATDVDVLANDTYLGAPTITIISGPDQGTASVVGVGTASRIRYTPPATGDALSDTLRYRLRATGNSRGSDNVQFAQNVASLDVTLTSAITFIQGKIDVQSTYGTSDLTLTLAATPATGNLLTVVVVTYGPAANGCTTTVKNALGNAYTQIGSTQTADAALNGIRMSMWRKVAADGASESTVTIHPSTSVTIQGCVLEHHGTSTSAPFDNSSATVDTSAGGLSTLTTGSIPIAGNHELIVCAFASFASDETGDTFNFATERFSHPVGDPGTGLGNDNGEHVVLFVGDILDEQLSTAQTFHIFVGVLKFTISFGASFTK